MKSIFLKIVFMLTMAFFMNTKTSLANPLVPNPSETFSEQFSLDLFLTITPHEYRKLTGNKLSFSQVVKLKLAQNIFKREVLKGKDLNEEPKSQIIAMLICILVGFLGIHRFYLGYTVIGVVQAITFGGCLIWWIIDIALILTGNLGPKDGSDYFPTFSDI